MEFSEYLEVSKLPSIPLSEKKHFPAIPCVYLVIDKYHVVHYVGRTGNLLNRWTKHHKYQQVLKLQQPRIAYLEVSCYLVPDVEAFLIRTFQPRLNIKVPRESDLVNLETL